VLETLEVATVRPYRDRPYEWVAAAASFAVDPSERANARVVDLGAAPTDGDGRVRFQSDVRMLRPTADGNGKALLVVPNRGMLGAVPFSLDAAPAMGPTEDPDPGDGFLLEEGWTIAWCGWQWDVRREKGWLGLAAPLADVGPGWMRVEFRPDVAQDDHRLSDSSPLFSFRDYPCADPDDPEAQLTERTSPLGEKRPIPRERWRFADDRAGVILDGGFQPFHWYELVYRSSFAPVVGTGLVAVRDVGSWLHRTHDSVFAFGISQSGRFLRQLLFEGMNVDEEGLQVFDGVFTHIASARRGEFNRRFGQPSLTHPLTPDYGPPFDTTGLLARQRSEGGVPRLFSTNSSWEYWRGDGALVHQDSETGADLPEDDDARTYLLAGTDHFGATQIKQFAPVANPTHLLDVGPVLRALFVQLVAWVCEGAEPPASRVPRRADATAVERPGVLTRFTSGSVPDPDHLPATPGLDPDAVSWPLTLGPPTVALVSDVDPSGNEVAGVRLPAVAVPVAAYTGWNPRRATDGLPDVLYEFCGSRLPLQSAEVLLSREDYERAVLGAARHLVEDRFLLERDVRRTVDEALRLYDART